LTDLVFQLSEEWREVGALGAGGFGTVYEVTNGTRNRALKVLNGSTSGWRDMLVNQIPPGPYAIPVLDSTEVEGAVLLLMPLAELSLAQHLATTSDLTLDECISILTDLAGGLVAMEEAGIVHRDIKPANVLRLEGTWRLTDFGEARFGDATTSASTHRFNMTPEYAAPERWSEERATIKTDVYSWGVIAHQLISGRLPFPGPRELLREQHQTSAPPDLGSSSAALNSLVKLTLAKSPDARPGAQHLRRGLQSLTTSANRPGLVALREASDLIAETVARDTLIESQARTRARRRSDLFESADAILDDLVLQFRTIILDAAFMATEVDRSAAKLSIRLGSGVLEVLGARAVEEGLWSEQVPNFDVIAAATIMVTQNLPTNAGFRSRAHSLWYGDIQSEGEYSWFEVCFASRGVQSPRPDTLPFEWDPDSSMLEVFQNQRGGVSIVRPFQLFNYESVEASASEWAMWLAAAASNQLRPPVQTPEMQVFGSWRSAGMKLASQPPPIRS
jgi:eukaryotic-like serine/threonine-protein kinase